MAIWKTNGLRSKNFAIWQRYERIKFWKWLKPEFRSSGKAKLIKFWENEREPFQIRSHQNVNTFDQIIICQVYRNLEEGTASNLFLKKKYFLFTEIILTFCFEKNCTEKLKIFWMGLSSIWRFQIYNLDPTRKLGNLGLRSRNWGN